MRSTKSAGAGSSGGGRRPAAKFSGPNNTPGRSLGKETRTRMDDISHDVCVNVKRARLVSGLSRTRCRRWLQRGRPGAADDEGRVGRLFVNDSDRAGDVVDRIGSLVKKAPPRKEAVDLNAAIREVIALTLSEAVKSGVTVDTQLAGDSPPIRCDRVQLQQVMLNLIVNAIQSMCGIEDGNRELHISTARIEPEGVCVAVRDTGPGLRPESWPRLFELFYTTKPDGMGMGLSICRSIVEAHGGRLWATSREPRGALFQFTIPAE
jgi:signal transduction histidine kinase